MIPKISGYIHHRRHARSKFAIHSPFVYTFYTRVMKDDSPCPACGVIEKYRNGLLKNGGFIRMTDLGSGSSDLPWSRKVIPVRRILRRSSVPPKWGRLLYRTSRFFQPSTILEFGTSLGISTAYLATGSPESTVTTIEGCEETAARAAGTFETLRLNHIRLLNARFDDVISYLLPEIGVLDMVFFDGNHRKETTVRYFESCLPFIRDHSVFIFDDIHWSEEMELAWTEICGHESVKISIDLYRMGLVFFREGLSKEDFILYY
jgi:hypothetical protein